LIGGKVGATASLPPDIYTFQAFEVATSLKARFSGTEEPEAEPDAAVPNPGGPEIVDAFDRIRRPQRQRLGWVRVLDLCGRGLTGAETINIFVSLQFEGLVVTQSQPLKEAVPDLVNVARQ
jgi:hypothetical protein